MFFEVRQMQFTLHRQFLRKKKSKPVKGVRSANAQARRAGPAEVLPANGRWRFAARYDLIAAGSSRYSTI
jgi:hypothetical protein